MLNLVIANFLTYMSGMMPVLGLLIAQIEIKRLRWIMLIESLLLAGAALLMLGAITWEGNPGMLNPALYAISLGYYPLMMALLLPLCCLKFGHARGLALTFMLGFLLTELHEIVAFGKMWLGQFDNMLALRAYWHPFLTPMAHAYVVIVAVLALKVSRFQRKWILPGLLWFMLGVMLEILIYPHLTFGIYDLWDIARRLLWLPVLLIIFMLGGSKAGKN